MKQLAVGVLIFAACGEVVKIQPDAQSIDAAVDAPPDAGCSATPPTAAFNWSPNPATKGAPTTFTAVETGLAYSWTFMGGAPATSTNASQAVTWSSAGTYDVTLTATDAPNHCVNSATRQVQINACAAPLNPVTRPSMNTGGWSNYGLQITPRVNTTLTSFVVENQGKADTINLLDAANTVVATIPLPANSDPYTATVSWPLTAGVAYRIVAAGADGLQWENNTFPLTNSTNTLDIPGGYGNGSNQTYYFGFTDFVTCP